MIVRLTLQREDSTGDNDWSGQNIDIDHPTISGWSQEVQSTKTVES